MIENNEKNFAKCAEKSEKWIQKLAEVCSSLTYISETDSPIEPFISDRTHSRSLEEYLNTIGGDVGPTEEVDITQFFDRLTTHREWHSSDDKKRAERFAKLHELLTTNLQDLRVIRVGRIKIGIYIGGISESGRLIGVKTNAIET